MGQVVLKYRIMPDGPETDLEALQGALKSGVPEGLGNMQAAEAVPFAFGMKALVATFVIEDEEGNNDRIEELISGTHGVQGVELLEMGRLM